MQKMQDVNPLHHDPLIMNVSGASRMNRDRPLIIIIHV